MNRNIKNMIFIYLKLSKVRFFLFWFLLIALVSWSCSKDEYCLTYEQAFITEVNGDTSGQVNKEVNFQISFRGSSSCAYFGFFEEYISENTITIVVNAKYVGCNCFTNAPIITTNYSFIPTQPGIYYLRFLNSENSFITQTLVVI